MNITATTPLRIDPQEAWEIVLEQLQMEMPRASFDTWVRDSRALSYEDGSLTIGVRNAYACEWLESRLQSTVSRLLIGIMNRSVDVEFVVAQPLVPEADYTEEKEEQARGYEIELAASTRYEAEVKPHRVVVFPGYALRLLAQGDLSVKEMSLWMGFRQAVYFDWRKAGGATISRNIPHQDVIRFAGMKKASYFRAIRDKDSLAGGMIRRLPDMDAGTFNPHLDNANRWQVSMSPRLTRQDAAVIELILSADIALAEESAEARSAAALHSLEELVVRSPGDYLDMKVAAPKRAPAGVVEILRRCLGLEEDIPAALFEAAEALQNKLMTAFGSVVVTHHFLTVAAPYFDLTQSQIWTAIVLRDRCFYDYETGIEHDFVMASKGLESLSAWTGVSTKSLKRWLEQPEFCQFVQASKVEIPENDPSEGAERLRDWLAAGGLIFNIRKTEPPLGYLTDEGTDRLVPVWTKRSMPLDKVIHGSGQSDTRVWTKWDSALDKVRLGFGQSETPLNSLYKPLLNPFKPHNPLQTTPKGKSSGGSSPAALPVAGVGWEMSALLKLNPVSDPKLRARLLDKGDPLAFASWLLYAYSPEGQGVQSPSNLAISNIARDPGQGAKQIYLGIARLGPERLRELIEAQARPYRLEYSEEQSGFSRIFRDTTPQKLHELASCLFEGSLAIEETF
jgi:hypothetical protein